jgi:hypothetical protein
MSNNQESAGGANVLPFRRKSEIIAGVDMYLWNMSPDELDVLVEQCRERVEDAQTDLQIVKDVRDGLRNGGGGGSAA